MCVVCVVLSWASLCSRVCLSLFLSPLPHCISHFTSDLLPCVLSLSARNGSRFLSRLTFPLMSCVSSDLDSFSSSTSLFSFCCRHERQQSHRTARENKRRQIQTDRRKHAQIHRLYVAVSVYACCRPKQETRTQVKTKSTLKNEQKHNTHTLTVCSPQT